MATWYELHDSVLGGNQGTLVPQSWLTIQRVFQFLTEAQHVLQMKTTAVKRSQLVTLDPNSADGSYDVPLGLDIFTLADRPTPALKHISIVSWDFFNRQIQEHEANGIPNVYPLPKDNFMVASAYNKLWVWPYKGATGSLVLQYAPTLPAWAPSETVLWPGYGNDPSDKMKITTPEPEFYGCQDAIVEFAIAKMCRLSPDWTNAKRDRVSMAERIFQDALTQLARRNEDYTASRGAVYCLVPGVP